MKVNGISANNSVYGLYDTMFRSNLSLNNMKMNKSFFPSNKAQNSKKFGENTLRYINDIKAASKDLSSTLRDLSGAAFNKKAAESSDTDVLTVKYTGNNPKNIKPTAIKVDQTAASQLNEGVRLDAKAAFGNPGTNKFSIKIGGKDTEFTVNIAADDTNKDVQQKMADAINKAGIGVKATVETDAKSNTSMLKLESAGTGAGDKNKFTVSDVTGTLAAKTGADEVKRQAQDAIFSINGGAKLTSQTNTVDIGNGLTVTFNKASEKTVTVSQGSDADYIKSAVKNLVKSYNDVYVEAAQRTNDPKAQNLASRMIKTSKTYSDTLSSIGIGFDRDGKMTLDDKKFDAAAEKGSVESFFTENSGKNYGFTNQISRLADNVRWNTSNYVSFPEVGNDLTENFGYTGFGKLVQYNYLNPGLFVDYSF